MESLVLEGSPMRDLGWASHTYGAVSLVHSQSFDVERSEARHKLLAGLRLSAVILVNSIVVDEGVL